MGGFKEAWVGYLRFGVFWALVVVGLMILVPRVFAGPVGCEEYNASVVKCWNQGSIENVTYFDTRGVQLANRLDRFSWAEYELGYVVAGDWQDRQAVSFSPDVLVVESDNASYYRLTWQRVVEPYPNKRFAYRYRFSQELYDDYVNRSVMIYTLDGFDGFVQNITIYTLMNHVDVGGDNLTDLVMVENDRNVFGLPLNDTYYAGNITGGYLKVGNLQSMGVVWRWRPEVAHEARSFATQAVQPNYALALYKTFVPPPGGFGDGRLFGFEHEWIDAEECIVSWPFGCMVSGRVFKTTDGDYVSDGDGTLTGWFYLNLFCNNLLGCGTIPPFGDCNPSASFSNGCYYAAYDNITWSNGTYMWSNDTSQDNPIATFGNKSVHQATYNTMGPNFGATHNFTIYCMGDEPHNFTLRGCEDFSSGDCERILNTAKGGDVYTHEYMLRCGEKWNPPPEPIVSFGAFPRWQLFGRIFTRRFFL